jgi:pyochelin synthetase
MCRWRHRICPRHGGTIDELSSTFAESNFALRFRRNQHLSRSVQQIAWSSLDELADPVSIALEDCTPCTGPGASPPATNSGAEVATTLHGLFESAARAFPTRCAVISGEDQITYAELNLRADAVARQLVDAGVERGSLVGLFVERSIDMVVGVLAIQKAAGAYVPLDPTYPADRLAWICEDARLSLILTQQRLLGRLSQPNTQWICLDTLIERDGLAPCDGSTTRRQSSNEPLVEPDQLAYVIYTSGSTGKPKGVMITHESAVNTILDVNARFEIGAGDRVLAISSLCFDLSVYDIFGLLGIGGTVVVPDLEKLREPRHWAELIDRHGITVWNSVPAFMEMLTSSAISAEKRFDSLRRVMLSGDWIAITLPDRIREMAPRAEVISLGGATEGSIWSIFYSVGAVDPSWKSIPYGRPLSNQQMLVLNDDLEQCPPAVVGEIYIGGDGVAQGYLNRPELNSTKFISDPFSTGTGRRLYRTGDLGRYLPDGNIEFLGRIDQQIKINGFRVELGEIETSLARHPDLAESVVTVQDGVAGSKRLVAFVVLREGSILTDHGLIESLRRELPEYMVPSKIVRMRNLPLNSNGKVDRSALATHNVSGPRFASENIAPRDEVERRLVRIWQDVFDLRPIGIRCNFFDLGGDSLVAAVVLAHVDTQFNRSISLDLLFEWSTIEKLAELIRQEAPHDQASPLVVLQRGAGKRPLVCVPGGGLWVFRKLLRYLDPTLPVLGMLPRGVDGREPPHQSIADIADYYVAGLRAQQPTGPYDLVGYSLGGTVAFEMAQRLRAMGERVSLLVLLDAPTGGRPRMIRRLITSASTVAQVWRSLSRRFWPPPANGQRARQRPSDEVAPGWIHVFRQHVRALDFYQPQPYPGRLTLLRSSVRPPWFKRLWDMSSLKWLKLARDGGVVHQVPGCHLEMFDNGKIEVVARRLTSCLNARQP